MHRQLNTLQSKTRGGVLCWSHSQMKPPPHHYKGLHTTSKGHATLLIPVAAMGNCEQANEFQQRRHGPKLSTTQMSQLVDILLHSVQKRLSLHTCVQVLHQQKGCARQWKLGEVTHRQGHQHEKSTSGFRTTYTTRMKSSPMLKRLPTKSPPSVYCM